MSVPSKITAGDRLKFTFSDSAYSPGTWTAKFTIRNASEFKTENMTDNGDGSFLCDVLTTGWVPGSYSAFITVTSGSNRYTIYQNPFDILVDPLSGAADDRTHIKRTLDILEAIIEGRVEQDTVSYSIAGRSVAKMSPEQLIALHDRYTAMYQKELRDARAANGQKISNKVKVRFR